MESKQLFTILGYIPSSEVQNYKLEYIRKPGAEKEEMSKMGIANVSTIDSLFMNYFNNSQFDILRCFVYFSKDSFIEIDTLSKSLYIKNKSIHFPFFDRLIQKGILGPKQPIEQIQWI